MATSAARSTPVEGDRAPDFTLPSTGGDVTLSSFHGRQHVLLAFFPLAFTSTCTTELCDLSEDHDAIAATGTVVLPISVDSVPTLQEFRAKYGLRVDLLSDFRREVSTRYGTLWQDAFFSNRAYFLVDRDGVVRWAHHEENPGRKRSNAEILERIAALR